MSSLPMSPGFPPYRLRRYGGFWLPDMFLRGIAASHARFKPRPTDVILASFPKSGTTWLKALSFLVLNRSAYPPTGVADHPLSHSNPHNLVFFLEANHGYYERLPSPRLLATHLPYSLIPPMDGRIVYVGRDPKDTLVSLWHPHEKTTPEVLGVPDEDGPMTAMPTFEEVFEFFCHGEVVAGPSGSTRSRNLRTLVAFMGCPFSPEEEAAGVVRQLVELCSLESLKGMQVNRGGSTTMGIKNEAFFRNGGAGDWSSCMTPAMAAQLDKLVSEALKGSTLSFAT
ncbi:unnamed protein product [Alopecurus aequalis]